MYQAPIHGDSYGFINYLKPCSKVSTLMSVEFCNCNDCRDHYGRSIIDEVCYI